MKRLLLLPCLLFVLLTACDNNPPGIDAEDNTNPFFRQAISYISEQNYRAAIKEYEKALRANPLVARAHMEIGLLYSEKLNEPISAIYHFQRYLQDRPEAPDKDQVQAYIDKAKIDFVLTLPNSPIQNAEEMARLSKENIDLRHQLQQTRVELAEKVTLLEQVQPVAGGDNSVDETMETTASSLTAASLAQPMSEAPASSASSTTESYASYGTRKHTIRSGDSLWKIASEYYPEDIVGGIKKIKEANAEATRNPHNLKLGTELLIP